MSKHLMNDSFLEETTRLDFPLILKRIEDAFVLTPGDALKVLQEVSLKFFVERPSVEDVGLRVCLDRRWRPFLDSGVMTKTEFVEKAVDYYAGSLEEKFANFDPSKAQPSKEAYDTLGILLTITLKMKTLLDKAEENGVRDKQDLFGQIRRRVSPPLFDAISAIHNLGPFTRLPPLWAESAHQASVRVSPDHYMKAHRASKKFGFRRPILFNLIACQSYFDMVIVPEHILERV